MVRSIWACTEKNGEELYGHAQKQMVRSCMGMYRNKWNKW
jgi:hypothetical protein